MEAPAKRPKITQAQPVLRPLRHDEVDDVVAFWLTENPDLDITTKALAMRIRRIAHLVDRAMRRELAATGVEPWEIEVLLSLRRAGDRRRSAGELARESQVTSGAITNRVDRLERRGWVLRTIDPDDRRQVQVTLTDDGVAQADRIIAAKNETEERIFAGVDRRTLERVTTDLRKVLASLEGAVDSDGD